MFDIDERFYFITSIVNMFWQIFTILFVLYKFTTFFGFIYNFTRFLGKMFKGIMYVKEEVSLYFKKSQALPLDTKPSFFTRIKNWIFGNNTNTHFLPTQETRTSFYGMENSSRDLSDFEYNMKHFNYDSIEFKRPLNERRISEEICLQNEQTENKEKPFNVKDSNIFFDSNFLMNILSRDAPKEEKDIESNEGFFQ